MRDRLLKLALVAVAAATIGSGTAVAQDIPPPGTPGNPHIAIDSTWYGTTLGVRYADLNATLAPLGSLYESGFRMRLGGYWVGYNYIYSDVPRIMASGDVFASNVQAGYGLNLPRFSALGLIGFSVSDMQNAGVHSSNIGFISNLSFSATPTDILLVAGQASYSTINYSYQTQAKVGLKSIAGSYVGVEGKLSGLLVQQPGSLVSQRAIGGGISNLPVGPILFALSAGYVYDNQLAGGAYFSASLYYAF